MVQAFSIDLISLELKFLESTTKRHLQKKHEKIAPEATLVGDKVVLSTATATIPILVRRNRLSTEIHPE
jgi:hypothetical protein